VRTTLDLDDDLLAAARALARLEGRSLGRVVSDLIRKGLRPQHPQPAGFPGFSVSPDAPLFGPEEVARALDEP
jgi:hypothetical protein